jgi:hypothetical protein
MRLKFGIRQAAISGGIFAALLFALVSIDPNVQTRFQELIVGQGDTASFAARASELGDALTSAVRYQSIENAPMMVFATVGVVLFLFMVRT